jgi:hypothetical protein
MSPFTSTPVPFSMPSLRQVERTLTIEKKWLLPIVVVRPRCPKPFDSGFVGCNIEAQFKVDEWIEGLRAPQCAYSASSTRYTRRLQRNSLLPEGTSVQLHEVASTRFYPLASALDTVNRTGRSGTEHGTRAYAWSRVKTRPNSRLIWRSSSFLRTGRGEKREVKVTVVPLLTR